ncbi:MAG: hypothetical protein CBB68_06715 [Rhodospirillaceae bacterium TMED8]|nr:hypothetical protein [Magnetovibrio sp.]OUT51307.1 MAG: hypothetical protein CBB68_06715 [Rhodospirillaceae bacterium TMED8]|tara:strand:- start:1100 stop:2077 length:978 start_codon:yes stop_codon:yes gene_type:complete
MPHNPKFALQENIAHNLLFVDGITRCGKSIFSGVIGTIQDCEHLRFTTLLEHIVPSLFFGVIDRDFAKSSMRTIFNEVAYETLLSRNANFRPNDQTSILNYYNPKLYIDRLSHEDGSAVIEKLREKKCIFPYQTHDFMVHLEYLDSLEFDYRMIQLYRHPIDNIYSWYTRGWGERFLDDPTSFTLSIKHKHYILPWYCAGYEEEWCTLNAMERCVRTVIDLLQQSISQHKKAQRPERILTITFEDMVQHTDTQMSRICKFLEREQTAWTEHSLKKANCPRVLDPNARNQKLQTLKSGISNNLFEQLMDMSSYYENNIYGLLQPIS